MHPPRYRDVLWPSERALRALQSRIERIRAQQGEQAALALAVEALALVDATTDPRNDTPELLLLPARRTHVIAGGPPRRRARRSAS